MLDPKPIYYYTLSAIAAFVLMWGVIDLASAGAGLFTATRTTVEEMPLSPDKGDQLFDNYYQKHMLTDRSWDAAARIIIAGGIFFYCRRRAA